MSIVLSRVFQAICSRLPGISGGAGNALATRDLASYLSDLPPLVRKESPASVKKLLESTEFVQDAGGVKKAWAGGKRHIVWQINPYLLLAWEKAEGGKWALKVFCAPSQMDLPPVKEGFFNTLLQMAFSFFQGAPGLSQWTAELKTRVSPLVLSYRDVSLDMFPEEWFSELEKAEMTDWNQLFSPLHSLEPAALSLDGSEEEEMRPFMGKPRDSDPSWWLHKAWLRHHLPYKEYKAFHFACRFTLLQEQAKSARSLEDRSVCSEVASKLLRSLFKEEFSMDAARQEEVKKELTKICRHEPSQQERLFASEQKAQMKSAMIAFSKSHDQVLLNILKGYSK